MNIGKSLSKKSKRFTLTEFYPLPWLMFDTFYMILCVSLSANLLTNLTTYQSNQSAIQKIICRVKISPLHQNQYAWPKSVCLAKISPPR